MDDYPRSERTLVGRLRAEDGNAVAELADNYGAKIYQLAFRYTKNHEDAEEIAQDVLLKVFRKIRAFRGDAALSSWIYRITYNTAMSRLRNGKFARPAEVSAELPVDREQGRPRLLEATDWSALGDEAVLRRELRDRLRAAVSDLPPIYRRPVILRDIQGLSTEEASRLLRVNTQTLKSRLHRGRLILRERLADFSDGLVLHRAA
ncbi:MAG: sigma-70 family RNA polymerase sigma factor [Luteitalea sp.]|nr:sigma-70 family RNA polymerase sigma factor [Luteitalea sp.]